LLPSESPTFAIFSKVALAFWTNDGGIAFAGYVLAAERYASYPSIGPSPGVAAARVSVASGSRGSFELLHPSDRAPPVLAALAAIAATATRTPAIPRPQSLCLLSMFPPLFDFRIGRANAGAAQVCDISDFAAAVTFARFGDTSSVQRRSI